MKGLVIYQQLIPAWLEGKKTVTRRLMNPQPGEDLEGPCQSGLDGRWMFCRNNPPNELTPIYLKLPHRPGETVYIKEVWRIASVNHSMSDGHFFTVQFKDFHVLPHPQPDQSLFDELLLNDNLIIGETGIAFGKWRSPRFMPEWVARSHALIKRVRPPERVQEITAEEVKKEGLIVLDFAGIGVLVLLGLTPETYMESIAIQEFQALWNSLHGKWKGVYRRDGGKRTLVGYECYPFDKSDIPPIPARARKNDLPCTAYPNPWVWPIEIEKQ